MTVVQSLFRLKKGKHINLKTKGNKSACKHDTQDKAIESSSLTKPGKCFVKSNQNSSNHFTEVR